MNDKKRTVELMDGQELARWNAARTMPVLGQMMAAWYNRDVRSRPGLTPGAGPDPMITSSPLARQALIDVNQVGFVTIAAQLGYHSASGQHAYLAAVQGFITTPMLYSLTRRLEYDRIRCQTWPVRPWWKLFGGAGTPVTYLNDRPSAELGRQMSEKQIRAEFDACHPDMIDVLVRCQQVTVYQPVAGVNDLWPMLSRWAFTQR